MPHDAVGDSVKNVDPHLQGAGVNLVKLVEVTEDDGVLRQHVLLPRDDQDLLGISSPVAALALIWVASPFWMLTPLTEVWSWPLAIMEVTAMVLGSSATVTSAVTCSSLCLPSRVTEVILATSLRGSMSTALMMAMFSLTAP